MKPTIEQKPTVEQLNQWSAEALEWKLNKAKNYPWYSKDGVRKYDVFDWRPATKLSQAWRELLPILTNGNHVGTINLVDNKLKIKNTISGEAYISKPDHVQPGDLQAAYAITFAFVQAHAEKSPGYLEWKAA